MNLRPTLTVCLFLCILLEGEVVFFVPGHVIHVCFVLTLHHQIVHHGLRALQHLSEVLVGLVHEHEAGCVVVRLIVVLVETRRH